MVIATAQLHSTKPELRFCAGSNPACGMLEIRNGEDLLTIVTAGNKAEHLLFVNHTTKTIHHHHYQIIFKTIVEIQALQGLSPKFVYNIKKI